MAEISTSAGCPPPTPPPRLSAILFALVCPVLPRLSRLSGKIFEIFGVFVALFVFILCEV